MGRGAGGGKGGGRGPIPLNISEGMAGRFAGAPREHIALVPGVVVRPEREWEIDSKRMGRQVVIGSTNLDTGEITLGRGATRNTATHELGHVVYELGLTSAQRSAVRAEYARANRAIRAGQTRLSVAEMTRLGNRSWISGYGFQNVGESFADGYIMWTNPRSSGGRERVARVAPELAAVLAETTGIGI